MDIQPLAQVSAVEGVDRVFCDNRVEVGEWQVRQFGDRACLTGANLAMRREIGELYCIGGMVILYQHELTHTNGICFFKCRNYCRNNSRHTRARQRPLVAEAIHHIHTKQYYSPLLGLLTQVIPGHSGYATLPLDECR